MKMKVKCAICGKPIRVKDVFQYANCVGDMICASCNKSIIKGLKEVIEQERISCQDCQHCKVDHDMHHSYLHCGKGKGCIDKNIFLCYECGCFERILK